MRERHKQRFAEATAKLREQHKLLARRAKQLESQLTRNSVRVCFCGVFSEVLMRYVISLSRMPCLRSLMSCKSDKERSENSESPWRM